MTPTVSRRALLAATVLGSAGLLASACASAPAPSQSVAPTVTVDSGPIPMAVPTVIPTASPTAVPTKAVQSTEEPTSGRASTETAAPVVPIATTLQATYVATQPASPRPAIGLKTGNTLPNFTFAGIDGKPITGADLTAERKPYILFFFATW